MTCCRKRDERRRKGSKTCSASSQRSLIDIIVMYTCAQSLKIPIHSSLGSFRLASTAFTLMGRIQHGGNTTHTTSRNDFVFDVISDMSQQLISWHDPNPCMMPHAQTFNHRIFTTWTAHGSWMTKDTLRLNSTRTWKANEACESKTSDKCETYSWR